MEKTNKKWHACKDCGGRIYDHRPETHQCTPQDIDQISGDNCSMNSGGEDHEAQQEPKKRSVMTIAETKLGVTMVLSKEECVGLGIETTKTTKEAIQEIRHRLGLPEKKKRSE